MAFHLELYGSHAATTGVQCVQGKRGSVFTVPTCLGRGQPLATQLGTKAKCFRLAIELELELMGCEAEDNWPAMEDGGHVAASRSRKDTGVKVTQGGFSQVMLYCKRTCVEA